MTIVASMVHLSLFEKEPSAFDQGYTSLIKHIRNVCKHCIVTELADKDIADKILQCLHELDEPYKEVFTLHALGDIPLTRISQLFGKSDSWARVTYYRAKAIITSKLKEGEK